MAIERSPPGPFASNVLESGLHHVAGPARSHLGELVGCFFGFTPPKDTLVTFCVAIPTALIDLEASVERLPPCSTRLVNWFISK